MMERLNPIDPAKGKSVKNDFSDARKTGESGVQFHMRDITNTRLAGTFASEAAALASLRGRRDGHFSINNHQGAWCEVEVRKGSRYIRHALMVDGSPAAFTKLDDMV